MSNTDLIRLRPSSARAAQITPFVEKALLYWGFSAAAGFWMAVIWWIVR